jgi:hypothetical protein
MISVGYMAIGLILRAMDVLLGGDSNSARANDGAMISATRSKNTAASQASPKRQVRTVFLKALTVIGFIETGSSCCTCALAMLAKPRF